MDMRVTIICGWSTRAPCVVHHAVLPRIRTPRTCLVSQAPSSVLTISRGWKRFATVAVAAAAPSLVVCSCLERNALLDDSNSWQQLTTVDRLSSENCSHTDWNTSIKTTYDRGKMSGAKMFENFLFNYNMTFIKFTKVNFNYYVVSGSVSVIWCFRWRYRLADDIIYSIHFVYALFSLCMRCLHQIFSFIGALIVRYIQFFCHRNSTNYAHVKYWDRCVWTYFEYE